MKGFLRGLLTFLMILSVHALYGQVTMYGQVSDMDSGSKVNRVKVSVIDGKNVVKTVTTGSDGKYSIEFPTGKKYKILFESPGYVSKFLDVDVKLVNDEDIPPGGKIFPAVNLDLFTEREGGDFSFLEKEPVVKWFYKQDHMDIDVGYVNRMKQKIQDRLDQASKAGAASDAQYNAVIQEADQLFDKQDYNAAMNKYIEAIKIPGKQAEKHPNNRIVEIGDLLHKQEEENLSHKQENQEYFNLIEAADNLASSKQYQKAIDKYYDASDLNPDEEYPRDRIKEIKKIVAEEAKRTQYDELIKLADLFYKQNSIEAARDNYEKASKLLPDEKYPKDQLAKLDGELDALKAVKEQKEKYNKAIEDGDSFFNDKEWERAIEKYQEAIELESASTYPAERIKLAQRNFDEEKAEAEKLADFNNLVDIADAHFKDKEYQEAYDKYGEALNLIDDDAVKTKRQNAKQLLDEELANAEKLENFNQLVALADENVEQEKYEDAIAKYTEALGLFNETEVQQKKQNAEQLFSQQKENAEKLDSYNALVKEGDKKVTEKEYQEAISKYNEALDLIDNDEVKKKRDDAQEALEAEQEALAAEQEAAEKEANFNQLVSEGDTKAEEKDYLAAIEKYEEALTLFDDNTVKKKRDDAQLVLIDLQKSEELDDAFNALVEEGNQGINTREYETAIEKYSAALKLKEDNEVRELLENAEKLLERQVAEGQKQEQITQLFSAAQEKVDGQDYTGAIGDYDEIIKLIGSDAIGISGVNDDYQKAVDGKENAQRLLSELQSQEELQEQFDELVSQADKSFDDENWEDAKTKYIAAKGIFGDKEHVNNRIEEIETIFAQIEKEKNTAAEIQILLDQAAQLKVDNKWGQVIQKYEEALALDDSRKDVDDLLSDAVKSKEDWDALQSKEELFGQLKQDGDLFMTQEKWNEAKEKYESALEIQEDSEIEAQLLLISEKLEEEQQHQDMLANYQNKIDEAEAFVTDKKYEEAISSFEEALQIKEDDAIATSRIEDVRQLIEQLENEQATLEKYQQYINEGNTAMEDKDFALAVQSFENALLEKPMDDEATRLRDLAKEEIRKLQSEEAQYQELIDEGQVLLEQALMAKDDIDKLEASKEKYKQAQTIRPDASLPQAKIVEIDDLIRAIQDDQEAINAENEKKYQDELQLADIQAQKPDYEKAIEHLENAWDIKPDETYPQEKIAEYREILNEIELEKEREISFNQLVKNADLAFENKNYQFSIDLYEEALEIKSGETYPLSQIEKAQQKILELEAESEELRFQGLVNRADTYFSNKDFEDALAKYEEAKEIKSDDSYLNDRINETSQIINNLREKELEEQAKQDQFDSMIAEADALFGSEDYLEAKDIYDKALEVIPDDFYAIEQSKVAVIKAEEKKEREENLAYKNLILEADESFYDKDYDKATELYNEAISLRSSDQYPKDKIDEITRIINRVKENSYIEDLGRKANISIIEGAALLEHGARVKEQLRLSAVEQQGRKFENVAIDLSKQDLEERQSFEQEVTIIKDQRDQLVVEEAEGQRLLIGEIQGQEEVFEGLKHQSNNFERGDVLRTNKELEFIEQEVEVQKLGLEDNHELLVERIKVLEEDRDNQVNAEMLKHNVGVTATNDELLKIEKANENLYELDRIKQRDLEVKVDDIFRGRELREFDDKNDNYQRNLELEHQALMAEIKTAENLKDKSAVTEQLREDIYVLDALIQRKNNQEVNDTYSAHIEIDKLLTSADNHYFETISGKDNERLQTVEQLKVIDQNKDIQVKTRAEQHYQETQSSSSEVDLVYNMHDAQSKQQKDDLALIHEEIKTREEVFDRDRVSRDGVETQDQRQAMNQLDKIDKEEEKAKLLKGETHKDNYENVKGIEAYASEDGTQKNESLRVSRLEMQDLLNKLEGNSITFTPELANTIGDEYPEGVSQENYIRKDNNEIPIKIVTRRFVVKDGHGDIYLRIQTRNGVTYSKNGVPITEQAWINGTENANLKKHY